MKWSANEELVIIEDRWEQSSCLVQAVSFIHEFASVIEKDGQFKWKTSRKLYVSSDFCSVSYLTATVR